MHIMEKVSRMVEKPKFENSLLFSWGAHRPSIRGKCSIAARGNAVYTVAVCCYKLYVSLLYSVGILPKPAYNNLVCGIILITWMIAFVKIK